MLRNQHNRVILTAKELYQLLEWLCSSLAYEQWMTALDMIGTRDLIITTFIFKRTVASPLIRDEGTSASAQKRELSKFWMREELEIRQRQMERSRWSTVILQLFEPV